MTVREVLLALGLLLGASVVVYGVSMLYKPAAVVLAGVLICGLTVLFLAEAD